MLSRVEEELFCLSKEKAKLVARLEAIDEKEKEQLGNKEALIPASTRVVTELENLMLAWEIWPYLSE